MVFSEPIANKHPFGCTNVKGTVDSKSKLGAGSVKNLKSYITDCQAFKIWLLKI